MRLDELFANGTVSRKEEHCETREVEAEVSTRRGGSWGTWTKRKLVICKRIRAFGKKYPAGAIVGLGIKGLDWAEYSPEHDWNSETKSFSADGGCGEHEYEMRIKGVTAL